ncbi:MAG: acyl-CoA thioesterase, partial [Alphaproteobacteria bacterium]
MGEWVETFKGAVLVSEYDSESHMNSQIYVGRFDQATWFLLNSIGITPRSMKKAGRRIAVVRQSYQFIRELKGGELVIVQSGFVAVGHKFFRFLHRMRDAETGELLATSDSTAVEASLA